MVAPLAPPALSERFPTVNLRAEFCRGKSLPEQCVWGLLTMFPPVHADIWNASSVVMVIALAEVSAWVSRRACSLAVNIHKAGQPALARRLINDLSGPALGNGLRLQLSTILSQLPAGTRQGSTPHSVSSPSSSRGHDPSERSGPPPAPQWHPASNYGQAPASQPQNNGKAGRSATMPVPLRVVIPRRCRNTRTGRCTAPKVLRIGRVPLGVTRPRVMATAMSSTPACSRDGARVGPGRVWMSPQARSSSRT